MKRHEFVTIALRLLGLLCIMFGVPRLVIQITAFLHVLQSLGWELQHFSKNFIWAQSNFGFSLGELLVGFLQVLFGFYLLLGGRWLQQRITRMERNACFGCGYDLSGIETGQRCPECGHGTMTGNTGGQAAGGTNGDGTNADETP